MNPVRKSLKLWLPGVLAFLLLGAIQGVADPVALNADLTGTTAGAFGQGSSAATVGSPATSISLNGVTINYVAGAINISGLNASNNFSFVTLGTFNVVGNTAGTSFAGATFTLNVTFTVPSDINPGGGTFNGTLQGTFGTGTSGTFVQWSNPTLTFTSASNGVYTLTLEPVTPITPGNNVSSDIRGQITFAPNTQPIPEPTTMVLLGTGLAGVITRLRKKKA